MKIGKEMQMSLNLIRWSGLAAILGGVLWIADAIQTGFQLRGCLEDECAFRPITVLFFAMLLLAVGVAGLVLHTRNAGRLGRLGWRLPTPFRHPGWTRPDRRLPAVRHYHPAGEGAAALGGGAVRCGHIGVALGQQPERAGVPGDPVRDSVGCGGVRPLVGQAHAQSYG